MRIEGVRVASGVAEGTAQTLGAAVDRAPPDSGRPAGRILVGPVTAVAAETERAGRSSVVGWALTSGTEGGEAVPPGIPAVARIPQDLIVDGDRVQVDGDRGWVVLPEVQEASVVTSFLRRDDGRLLILLRSRAVGSNRELWAGVSGYLEPGETALQRAWIEIEEETGIPRNDPELLGEGVPILVREAQRAWKIHPFLFRVRDPSVRIDWEHSRFEWVTPEELGDRPAVPKLVEVLRSAQNAADRSAPQRR